MLTGLLATKVGADASQAVFRAEWDGCTINSPQGMFAEPMRFEGHPDGEESLESADHVLTLTKELFSGDSLEKTKNACKERFKKGKRSITYQKQKGSWAVLSGLDGNQVFYGKLSRDTDGTMLYVEAMYARHKRQLDGLAARLIQSIQFLPLGIAAPQEHDDVRPHRGQAESEQPTWFRQQRLRVCTGRVAARP